MRYALSLLLSAALLAARPAAADPATDAMEAARQAYAGGALLKAVTALQTAMDSIQQRLAQAFVPLMPAAPAGWKAFDAQADATGVVGGGMAVMRGYEKGDASLNASLILDTEAVAGIADMLANPAMLNAQPGMTRVNLDAGPALMRWDPQDKSGEIMLVIGDSLLLQVVGNGIDKADVLVEMMRRWDVPAIKKQAGL